MGNTSGDAYGESLEAITTIKAAWENGHTLVPLLGAGVSVDSGMPLVDSIMSYLVMIRQYVKLLAYRPQYEAAPYKVVDQLYQQHPIRYIRDYGWPDPFQLRHELMLQYAGIDEILRRASTGRDDEFRKYLEGLAEKKAAHTTFDQWIYQELDNEVSQLKKWQKAKYDELVQKIHKHDPSYDAASTWTVLGDWRAVIRDFTEFTRDDADSLFERLYRRHDPGRSHHFWAFLTRLMGLRLFLTTNFDNFLERALAEQGIDHRVFGVEHGDNLPHESLVRETVSVIKLHGDTHRLLLDEKLDYPPSPDYLERLQACMPIRPVMVVMGCGGNDPRTLEVVKHHGENHENFQGIPSVIWLHFEPGGRQRTLQAELKDSIKHARVTNPGMFLSHLYGYLRSQHPASRVPYSTHLAQLVAPLHRDSCDSSAVVCHKNDQNNAFLFEQAQAHSAGRVAVASQVMADFVYEKKLKEKYTPIWIDLETHHSVAGVVQQIVEQCRTHDTFVSPFDVQSNTKAPEPAATLTVERLFHVLRRGRYVLALDALEAFLWAPSAHHGAPRGAQDIPEIDYLFTLLTRLMTHGALQGGLDVVLCASFDLFRERGSPTERKKLLELISMLVKATTGGEIASHTPRSSSPSESNSGTSPDVFVISCFRRPRSLVSLRSVFRAIFGDKLEAADGKIDRLIEDGYLFAIEGGFFRMQHGPRDEIYKQWLSGTRTEDICRLVRSTAADHDRADLTSSIRRCYAYASTHGLIARCYYTESYLHSLDPWIFFEYFYHRITSLRYITKLVVLLKVADCLKWLDSTIEVVIPPSSVNKAEPGDREYSLDRILEYVEPERRALLQSLKHALIQAQSHLVNRLPAAQLEGWCNGVLSDVFKFSTDSPQGAFDLVECRLMRELYDSQEADDLEFKDDAKEIFWTLLGLLRKSLYEQGRNEPASRLARVQLEYRLAQVGGRAGPRSDGSTSAILGRLRETAKPGASETEECVRSLLDAIAGEPDTAIQAAEVQKHYNAQAPKTLLGKQNQLRALCMLAEERIRDCSDERFDVCVHSKLSASQAEQRRERLELIDTAVDLCRVVSPEGARDSSHDPYYLRFRARLLIAKVRLQWLGTETHEPFREADCLLERARASVSADDHARLARLEMTWAEGLLLQANRSLNGHCVSQEFREQSLAAARVDYQRAGDALQRARDHLTRSSRDVERWLCFQRLWAQYQAEWCLLHLAHLESELRALGADPRYKRKRELADRTPHNMAALLKRLKRGLNGLQAGLVIPPDRSDDPWLRRIWLELLCAGMIYGVTTAAGTSCYEDLLSSLSQPWPLGIQCFWEHWRSLNERAGIPITIGPDGTYSNYLKETIEDRPMPTTWRADMVARLRTPYDRISKLRDTALQMANGLYDGGQLEATLTGRIIELVVPAAT